MDDIYEQQGADITAAHMIIPEQTSEIQEFFKDSTVLITGATGFIGKLCMEKLLRTCDDIKKIYILIRPKTDKDLKKRFDEIFAEPIFDPLKRKKPDFIRKVFMVHGDCSLPDLALNEEDKEKLISEVDCVFHYAATVRFNETLRVATYINVRGVRDIINIAKQMKKLRAMVHVSTAFSNCNNNFVEETFYEPPMPAENLLTLVECLDDEKLDAITKTLLGKFPNTYTFTKCIAEDLIKKEAKNLPIAVYRPSIVIATAKEPVAGWIDNVYGPTGVLLGVAVGLLRVLHANEENKADVVPADYVVNSCLAAAWDVATMKTLNDNKETHDTSSREDKFEKEIPVYNFISSTNNPMTWHEFNKLSRKHCVQIPSEKCIWHSVFFMIPNKILHLVLQFLLHTIPSYIVDFIAICFGKKPMLIKGYEKVNKFTEVLAYFTTNEWNFGNNNSQSLWKRMSKYDRQLFDFDINNLNWDMYFYTYTRGARVYILKDPLDTIPKGAVKYYKLMFAHYAICGILLLLTFKLVMFLLGFIIIY